MKDNDNNKRKGVNDACGDSAHLYPGYTGDIIDHIRSKKKESPELMKPHSSPPKRSRTY